MFERYTCDKCEHVLTSKEALTRHRLRHRSDSNEKRHRCTLCTYATNYSSHLKQHMFTHSGERPFKCTECNSAFTQNWHLRKHMLGHAAKLMLKCDRCPESFGDAKLLQKHTKLHKREDKPFLCSVCAKRFPRSSSLRRHEKKHLEDKRTVEKPFSKTKSTTNGDLGLLQMKWSPTVQDETLSTLVGNCSPISSTEKSSHSSKDLLMSGRDTRKSSSLRDKDGQLSTSEKDKPDASVHKERSSSCDNSKPQNRDKGRRVRATSHIESSDKGGHSSTSEKDKQDVSVYKERSSSSDKSKSQDRDRERKDRSRSTHREKSSDKDGHSSTSDKDKSGVSVYKEKSSSSDVSKPQESWKVRIPSGHIESSDKDCHSSTSEKDKQDVSVYVERCSSSDMSKPQDRDEERKDRATSGHREKSSDKDGNSSTSEKDKLDVSVYKERSSSCDKLKSQGREKERKGRAKSGHREKSSDKDTRSNSYKEKFSKDQREKTHSKFLETQKQNSSEKGNFPRSDNKEEMLPSPHKPKSPPQSEENETTGKRKESSVSGKRKSPTANFKPPLNLSLKN